MGKTLVFEKANQFEATNFTKKERPVSVFQLAKFLTASKKSVIEP